MFNIENIKDLETKGFVVCRNMLDENVIQGMAEDYLKSYNEQKSDSTNYHGVSGNKNILSAVTTDSFKSVLSDVLDYICKSTDIKVNYIPSQGTYFDTEIVDNRVWHTDHEPYYLSQNCYNVLAIWIPIIKPVYEKSNMMFLPHNKVPEPERTRLKGNGAQYAYILEDGTTDYREYDSGYRTIWNFNVDDLAETVYLNTGDAVIFRDDTLHKTQDIDTRRVSFAIRCFNLDATLSKEQLNNGSVEKFKKINLPNTVMNKAYTKLMNTFEQKQSDTITFKDFLGI